MVFKYVKYFDLIEASAVSTEWYFIAKTSIFTAKLKETNQFFFGQGLASKYLQETLYKIQR